MKAILIWWLILLVVIISLLCYAMSDTYQDKVEKRRKEWNAKSPEERNSKLLEYIVIMVAIYIFSRLWW